MTYNASSRSFFGMHGPNVFVSKSTFVACDANYFAVIMSGTILPIEASECIICECSIDEIKDVSLTNCQVNKQISGFSGSLTNPQFFFDTCDSVHDAFIGVVQKENKM